MPPSLHLIPLAWIWGSFAPSATRALTHDTNDFPLHRELKRIPEDLRDVLERCLAEDASPENLELYLPSVRRIITHLLEGLRQRQDEYKLRNGVSDSTRSHRSSRSELAYADESVRSDDATGPAPRSSGSRGSRSGATSAGESTRSRRPADIRRGVSASASDGERSSTSTSRSNAIPLPPVPQASSASRAGQPVRSPSDRRAPISRSAASTPAPTDTEAESGRVKASPRTTRIGNNGTSSSPPQGGETKIEIGRNLIPPEVPRYSLQDRPMAPSFSVEVTSPTSPSSLPDSARPVTPEGPSTPAVESSLAALKQSDALQRRASKRFSTYTMSKMAGSGIGITTGSSNGLRRSVVVGAALTPGDLVALTEVDEGAENPVTPTPRPNLGRKKSIERRQRAPTLDGPSQPPIPTLPGSDVNGALSVTTPKQVINGDATHKPKSESVSLAEAEKSDLTRQMTIFLQIGGQVKKVTMEPVTSFAQLRVLFMNKFLYNPGKENFPEIYIRDPASGVQYELEDVAEVKDKCLLSLNIERKYLQHINQFVV